VNDRFSSFTSRLNVPGLLPWQSYFLAFVLGVFSYRYPVASLTALGVVFFVDACFRGWLKRLPLLAFLMCAVFGFSYAAQRAAEPVDIPEWMEKRTSVVVHGVVDRSEPRTDHRRRIILRDLRYELDGQERSLPGMLVWNWRSPDYTPAPGQSFKGRMRVVPVRGFANPGGWDYDWYWLRQGVQWRAWPQGRQWKATWGERPADFFWSLKSGLRSAVARNVPDTQGGAMVLALVTGDKFLLSAETTDAVRSAGLSHTLALSGLHVGFVAAMGFGLAWLVGWLYPSIMLSIPRPKLGVLFAAPLVLAYAWIGQPSPSLVRAAVMYGVWGFLLFQGRGRLLFDGLFFALAAIVLFDPLSVFGLSLQMSAVAVAGIGLMFPQVRPLFRTGGTWWRKAIGWAGGLLALSLCANLALLPLVSWYFGTWTPNILFNLVWLPVLGCAVMPLGLVGALFVTAPLVAPFGAWCLGVAAEIMDWLLALLHLFDVAGYLPVTAVLRPLWPEIVGCAVLLAVALTAWANRQLFPGVAAVGFLFMVAPHVSIVVADAQDEVRLTVIDVGLGQSALISLPGGHRWLVDGGGGSSRFDIGEAVVAPYLTRGRAPRLDGVFMSHPDSDHSHGLPYILSRFEVGAFYTNGMLPRGRTGKKMRAALVESGLVPQPLYAGAQVALEDDTVFEVLHPAVGYRNSHANERSLVLRLVRDGKGLAVIPGDVENDGLISVAASAMPLKAEVLVLPHHGSKSSLNTDLYHGVSAEAALCSNGYLNRYGFPDQNVLDAVGVPVFSTSRHGLIQAIWNADNVLSIRAFLP